MIQKENISFFFSFVLSDLLNNLERVSDHCSNVAVAIIELQHNSFDTHEYLHEIKRSDNENFKENYNAFLRKYAIKE